MKQTLLCIAACAVLTLMLGGVILSQDVSNLKYPKLNEIKIPNVETITLDNGMRLYILEDKTFPVLEVNLRINCGSYLEPAEKIGLAGICGTVMRTGGTSKWTGDEIDELLEGVGGSVETRIGLASANASVNILSDYTDLGLEVLAEIIRRPVFEEDRIELSKVQIRSGISRRNDDVGTVARREFTKLIYGAESPYARIAEYATIDAIAREDLVDFHKTYIAPQNIQMAIWGDIDKTEIIAKIKQYFDDWENNGIAVPPPPAVDYEYRSKVYYVEKKDAKQSYIRIGHIGGMVSDSDYTNLIVMNSIMGGGFGSRVTNSVRTKLGLAYSVGGRIISNFSYPGYFFVVASTKPQSTVQATREMIKQIKSMQTDIATEREMKKGKDGYLNSFVFNFDSRAEILGRMMTYDFYGLPEDFLQQEKEQVEKVTPEDIMAAANRNLRTDEMIVVVTGNMEQFEIPLDSLNLGPAEFVDITIPSGEKKEDLEINDETLAKGKDLIDKAVAAAGGIDNFKKIKSMSIKGTVTITTPQGDFSITIEEITAFPDKQWSAATVMGQKMLDIRNGNVGWKTDPMAGELAPKTEEEIMEAEKEMKRNTFLIFMTSDQPAYQAVYNGSGSEGGSSVEYVAIVGEDGQTVCTFGFDPQSYQLVSKSNWGSTPMGDGMLTQLSSDFSEINGLSIPMTTVTEMNGQKATSITITDLQINPEIPAGTFDKP